jgi:hypothetical protein
VELKPGEISKKNDKKKKKKKGFQWSKIGFTGRLVSYINKKYNNEIYEISKHRF